MSTIMEFYKKREDTIREHWFKEHVAEHRTHVTIDSTKEERLIWKKPGTNINRIDYRRFGGILVATGDLGDAIYQWYGPEGGVTLEWIAGLNLDYFAEKCLASEEGAGYKEWSKEAAKIYLKQLMAEEGMEKERKAIEGLKKNNVASAFAYVDSKEDWIEFLNNWGDEVFGSACFEYCGIGTVVNMRCQGHLLGLRMALLEKK